MTAHQPPLRCNSSRPNRRTSRAAFWCEPPEADDPLLSFAPYLHAAPRRNSITPDRQRGFIAALAATGIVTQAAREIGASLEALYKLRHRPGAEGFSAAWDMAIDRGIARLEDCVLERALTGEERPLVSGGEVIGTWRRFDTALALFLLRQRRADRYGSAHHFTALRPGHPVYERLRAEWEALHYEDDEAITASLDAKIALMRSREAAVAQLLAEDGEGEGPIAPA